MKVGKWIAVTNGRGRRRLVRVVELRGDVVLVDTNRRFAGQTVEFEIELVEIGGSDGHLGAQKC